MAEVMQVFTIVQRLYSPVSLPWNELVLSTNLNRVGETYKFKEVGQSGPTDVDATTIVAKMGEFSLSGLDNPLPVMQLTIQPNVVEAQTATESGQADGFPQKLEFFNRALDPNKTAELEQYTTTHQTIANVK